MFLSGTGGIRCDVYSTFLRSKGFTNLYTLEGGIQVSDVRQLFRLEMVRLVELLADPLHRFMACFRGTNVLN